MAEEIRKQDDNVIYIGTKPFMNYVSGVDMQFNLKGGKKLMYQQLK